MNQTKDEVKTKIRSLPRRFFELEIPAICPTLSPGSRSFPSAVACPLHFCAEDSRVNLESEIKTKDEIKAKVHSHPQVLRLEIPGIFLTRSTSSRSADSKWLLSPSPLRKG